MQSTAPDTVVVDRARFDAALFDLDGVITHTAKVHSEAWKQLFDDFLRSWSERNGVPFEPFDIGTDYLRYVDGKPRYDGVNSFLQSRGIYLPYGTPDDEEDAETCSGLGNRKNRLFNEYLAAHGADVFDDTVDLLRRLREAGFKTGVVSASKNCEAILRSAGLFELFDTQVSGVEAAALGLPGKPAPDTFLQAAAALATPPERAVVFEDAISGVQAGQAGGFGLVVGVDRVGQAEALAQNGADVVMSDLTRIALA